MSPSRRGGRRPGAGARPKPPAERRVSVQVRVSQSCLDALSHRLAGSDPHIRRRLVERGLRALAELTPGGALEWALNPDGTWQAVIARLGPHAEVVAFIDPEQHGYAVRDGRGGWIVLRRQANAGLSTQKLKAGLQEESMAWWDPGVVASYRNLL